MPRKLLIALLALATLAAACSGSDTVQAGDGEVVISDDGSADGGAAAEGSNDDDSDGSGAAKSSDDPDDADGAGDDTSGSDGDAAQAPSDGAMMFADAVSGINTTTSARFEGRFLISGVNPEAPETPVEMLMTGVFDQANDAMELNIDLTEMFAAGAAGDLSTDIPPGFEDLFAEPMQLITIGGEGWLKWGLLSLFTGQEDAWLSLGADDLGTATEGFGFGGGNMNPTDLLDSLSAANANVEDLGTETVRGVEARHVRALVDVEALAAELDAAEQAELEEQLGDLTNAAYPIELWVGVDDGLLYRYQIDLTGDALVSADAPPGASAFVSFEFFDHGVSPGITAPPADQVVDGESILGGGLG